MSWLSDAIGGFLGTKQADAAKSAANRNNEQLQYMFDRSVELNEPFRQSGIGALNLQNALLGVAPAGGLAAPGQEAAGATNFDPYASYVSSNPDLQAEFGRQGRFDDPSEYGQWHWSTFGQNEGRTLPQYQGSTQTQTPTTAGTGMDLTMPQGGGQNALMTSQNDAYDLFNNSGFAKSMLETTDSDMDRMLGAYASGGKAMAGPTLGALNDRNRRNTSTAFNNYYNALSGMSGTGAQLSQAQGQQGMNMAQMQGQNNMYSANAKGSSYNRMGDIFGNALAAAAGSF